MRKNNLSYTKSKLIAPGVNKEHVVHSFYYSKSQKKNTTNPQIMVNTLDTITIGLK
jgi:hypothetical protein